MNARHFVYIFAVLAAVPRTGLAGVDYATQVKPLLRQKCYECHGGLKQEEGLRLDTVALMLKGGKSAAIIDVGEKPADAAEPHKIQCPVCHTPMITLAVHGHKGLKYESCTVCFGSFFDAGEFREYAGSGAGWFRRLLAAVTAADRCEPRAP